MMTAKSLMRSMLGGSLEGEEAEDAEQQEQQLRDDPMDIDGAAQPAVPAPARPQLEQRQRAAAQRCAPLLRILNPVMRSNRVLPPTNGSVVQDTYLVHQMRLFLLAFL